MLKEKVEMRKKIVAILISVFLLSTAFCMELGSSLICNSSCTLNSNLNSKILARYGKAYLENVSGLLVLHVKGSPYEMGYQNGFLLKDYVNLAYLEDYLSGYNYEYLVSCSQTMEPYIPQEFIEEMHGFADGANMNYTDILVLHTHLDAITYCSGFAVFGDATIDGHLYHGRNEDWSLPPENMTTGLVTVYEPENGNAFVNVGHFGVIGVGSGMNKEGISLGFKLSHTSDTTLDGMPIWFILRKVLQYSSSLSQAIDIINQTDRTTGWNIVLGDGKNLNAFAIEISDNYCKVFWAGDSAEDIPPHYSIENAVRRTNHYIDPELRATQSSTYDPTGSDSWNRYEKLSQLILDNYGNISAEMSIQFLKTPPVAGSSNLQSVVFDSTDMELWVANAKGSTSAYQREYIHLSYTDLFSTPVGGIYIPVNKLELLATYIELTILLAVAVMTAGYAKKRKRRHRTVST